MTTPKKDEYMRGYGDGFKDGIANKWLPIETAPEGRCLMWVLNLGEKGTGASSYGYVWVYPESRSYRPEGCHGSWTVTHWMPLPNPPVQL